MPWELCAANSKDLLERKRTYPDDALHIQSIWNAASNHMAALSAVLRD